MRATTTRCKRRLDIAVAQAASVSRERAQALILEGKVTVDGAPAIKAGAMVDDGAQVEVRDDARYASRGGVKLERALDEFVWSVRGLACIDVGASTGGFTDCLLQRGARSVTAVDVGYGQIAWALRNDPRVRVVERCNFRHAQASVVGSDYDFASVDVSFISLALIAGRLAAALKPGARVVALVKPQFEAGRDAVGKGGVVRDAAVHEAAIASVADAFRAAGLAPVALTFSPITGPAGNIEFLLGAVASPDDALPKASAPLDVAGTVAAAHEALAR